MTEPTAQSLELDAALAALISRGLTFSNCVAAFGTREDPGLAPYVAAAQRIHGSDGDCEIDDGAVVSVSADGGAYVMGWLWVTDAAAGIASDDDESAE